MGSCRYIEQQYDGEGFLSGDVLGAEVHVHAEGRN
jgi:hypothetical protein